MQNKGFVKVFALLLTLVCVFYLSFSFVTRYQMNKVEEITQTQGEEAGARYLDSVMNNPVWLGAYSLKDCREMEINPAFNKAVEQAVKESKNSQSDFITLFIKNYKALAPNSKLAELFATQQLKGRVNTQSSDSEVEKVLREEVDAAIGNSYNVLRTRIDRFGVAQPNIQTLEGQSGRIMVEMPGIKEPERVRKLLQGSANLEFWETYNTEEIVPFLATLDSRLAAENTGVTDTTAQAKADTAMVAENKTEADTTAKAQSADLAAALKGGTAEGKLYIAKPNKIRMEYADPTSVLIVGDGDYIIYNDKDLDQVTHIDYDDIPATLILADDIKIDGKKIKVTDFYQDSGSTTITLEYTEKGDLGPITLVFSNNPMELKQWKIVDPQSVEVTVSLYDTQKDKDLDERLFKFKDSKAGPLNYKKRR